jgi:hypothetical protein
MICPLCGIGTDKQKEWRQCPRESEIVCTRCCRKCKSYNKEIHRCMYRADTESFIKAHAHDTYAIAQRIIRNLKDE